MIAVALRSLWGRKLRTALTMIAIVLGVSMISGTYVLTDTINHAFTQIFQQGNRSTDVVITSQAAVQGGNESPPAFPVRLLTVVRHTSGVSAAAGGISDRALLVDRNGKPIGATQGAPSLLVSRLPAQFAVLKLIQGKWPHGNQMALDVDTMKRDHLKIGQRIGIVAAGPVQRFAIVGKTKYGSVGSLGGATLIAVDLPTAQRITGKVGKLDQIRVAGRSGVSPIDLAGRIKARIPRALKSTVKVQTARQNANAQAASIGQSLGALTNILLAFGAIALFVGAFVIFNTFSITVAQRAREFALLRTLGATRAQVLRSVMVEAIAVGVVASVIGFFAGIGLARGLNALFVSFGVDLPNTGLVIAGRTVVVAFAVGILVTIAASVMPAIRATRVPPIAALREGAELPRGRWQHVGPWVGGALSVLGLALLGTGTLANISATGGRLGLIGTGALLLFVGVAMLSPRIVGPMARALGWPVERLTRVVGRLARDNAARNPGRTAVTAAALMVGLALVGFVTIFAAELKATALDALNREVVGTYAIYNDQGRLIPAGVAGVVRKVPGVTVVSSVKVSGARLATIGEVQTNGIQPNSFEKVYRFQWVHGSSQTLRSLGPNDALVEDSFAKSNHLTVGSTLRATTPAGTHATFKVAGVYKGSDILTDWSIRYDTMRRLWGLNQDDVVVANVASGKATAAMKGRLTRALQATYPIAAVHSQQDLKNQDTRSIDTLLNLIYLLLAMSVLVSLFGIVNTLVLSVYERTREIGMLRAIGTTRGQVRWIVRWESVITSVIGAILGLIVGIVLAFVVTTGLQSQGLEYSLPIGNLAIWVVFAFVLGIVAAAYPARRAARLDVLSAIGYE
jgi:putative ABC transport system permease protein